MTSVRRAVIDIGTNSIKLLVAEVSGPHVQPLCEESEQTRLGKGLYETHHLGKEAIHATAYFAAKFAEIARAQKVANIRVIATSAARDAVNQSELLQTVAELAGLRVEVISGAQEAELAFQGVTSDAALDGRRLCILEVGGGSAQFIMGEGRRMDYAQSFKLGGVRLMELFPISVPPLAEELRRCRAWLGEFIAREIEPAISPVLGAARARRAFIGVGSAAKALMRLESRLNSDQRQRLKALGIPLATVTDWTEEMWNMSLSERKRLVGLSKKRADVIPFGAAIFEAVMLAFGFTHLRVSKRGIRHGAVQEPAA